MISSSELRALPLFKDVSANAVARLAMAMRDRSCKAGEVILREGDRDGGLFLVAEGRVAIRKRIDETRSKVIAHVAKGAFFGEMSLVDKQPTSAEAVAEEACRLFVLTRSDFEFLMSKAPQEALDHMTTLLSSICRRLRQTTRELVAVYQVARDVGNLRTTQELAASVIHTLIATLGSHVTAGLFQWDPQARGYSRVAAAGPSAANLPATLDRNVAGPPGALVSFEDAARSQPFAGAPFPAGQLVMSRCDAGADPQALFVYFTPVGHVFDGGDRQAMETISSVLAPAFATARAREEDESRHRGAPKQRSA